MPARAIEAKIDDERQRHLPSVTIKNSAEFYRL